MTIKLMTSLPQSGNYGIPCGESHGLPSVISRRVPSDLSDTFDEVLANSRRAPTASEIVYPCIPDLDGEDEGGQASSSLAVSTRWISAVKLLQSDLATLAQREGGE
ncbi:hypothetical protein BHM03_00033174 [Ensete ventricosum]|nr:hypothetical protein BHM03_00033174 [Ensete ventricosum]